MSICNLFTRLNKSTGNILMFSQYAKDLTKSNARDESYKIIPSRFIAMDIDYNSINIPIVGNSKDLNIDLPIYFQNFYENSCAYCESHLESFTPNNAKSLFWNAMNISGMIRKSSDSESNDIIYENNYIKYIGDINIQSFDEYNGMGYSEIYCHIPSEYNYQKYTVEYNDGDDHLTNPDTNNLIEGFDAYGENNEGFYPSIVKYNRDYYHNGEILISEVDDFNNIPSFYNINTIVVLYDIYSKNNDGDYIELYKDIPMGIYFTGTFDSNNNISNTITKYMSNEDSFGMGTSYGLRICSRFTVTPNNMNINSVELILDGNDNYSAFCQVMTKMSENIDKMNEVISNTYKAQQNVQDILAVFKNNRINTPYIREVGGKSYWFVNGKLIGESVLIERQETGIATPAEINNIKETIINKL